VTSQYPTDPKESCYICLDEDQATMVVPCLCKTMQCHTGCFEMEMESRKKALDNLYFQTKDNSHLSCYRCKFVYEMERYPFLYTLKQNILLFKYYILLGIVSLFIILYYIQLIFYYSCSVVMITLPLCQITFMINLGIFHMVNEVFWIYYRQKKARIGHNYVNKKTFF